VRTPDSSLSSPQDARDDRDRRATASRQPEDREASPADVEAKKAHALVRIWRELNDTQSAARGQQGSDAGRPGQARADTARAIRSLVEEMQKDPEVADAIRADLVAALRTVAEAHVERRVSDDDLDDPQRQLFGTDRFDEVQRPTPRARSARTVLLARRAEQPDSISRLRDAEDFLGDLHLSQLQAAAVLAVTIPDRLGDGGIVVSYSVDVADSLEKLREATHELSKSAEILQTTMCEVEARVIAGNELYRNAAKLREAARELSRCTERLRIQLQQIVEDRLVSNRSDLNVGFFMSIGEMIDTGPRLRNSGYDPGLKKAFEATGDLLTRSLLDIWRSSGARPSAAVESVTMAQR